MPVVFRSAAAQDVRRARASLDAKRAGLGADFVEKLNQVLSTVQQNAELFQIIEPSRQVRRALTRRFPYAVYYFIERQRGRVVVIAVLPTAMDPSRWRERA